MAELLQRKVKQRLFALTPRAFEFFAGDLLEYLGLSSVVVTRQSGDGGIDAHCEIVSGGVFRVPAGVQVKRHQHAIARPEFAMHSPLTMSYKPVLLLAMLDLAAEDGTIAERPLVERFWSFYRHRYELGLRAEAGTSLLSQPTAATFASVRALLIKYPLNRFIIQGFIEHRPEEGLVRFLPQVWNGLSYRHVLALRRSLLDQVERYFARIQPP